MNRTTAEKNGFLKVKTQETPIDAILISGDFVVHGMSSNVMGVNKWPEMKVIIRQAVQMISESFPGVPIIPNIGNNDLLYHYQTPNASEKAMFYGDLYEMWFDQIEAN